MKLTLAIILVLAPLLASAQPILRNRFTTNTDGLPVDGGTLQNLNGTQLQGGTVNSNKLDAPTQAQLALGGQAPALVGKLPALDGSNLFNLNISGSTITNLSNWTAQLGTFIGNVPPLNANAPLINGFLSTHVNSHLWTNSSGSWSWHDPIRNVDVPMHVGDFLCASNNPAFTDQNIILSFPSPGVAFAFFGAVNSYPAPGVFAVINPAYLIVNDTVPRPTAFISDDGGIGIAGNGIANSGGYYIGGGTNWWFTDDFNDTSGNGYTIRTGLPGKDVVFQLYQGALGHALDVYANGVVDVQFGLSNNYATGSLGTPGAVIIQSGLKLNHNQTMELTLTNAAPANTTTPLRWFPITNNGAVFLLPGYQ